MATLPSVMPSLCPRSSTTTQGTAKSETAQGKSG